MSFVNNFSFSLYAMLSVCYMVITSDKQMKSKMEVSADVSISLLNTED